MAYESKDLSVLAYANGFTLWHYTTIDTAAVVDTAGYFNDASDWMRAGDMIFANTETDAALKADIFFVKSHAGGMVNVDNLTSSNNKEEQS